jgi:hypothetical protein
MQKTTQQGDIIEVGSGLLALLLIIILLVMLS